MKDKNRRSSFQASEYGCKKGFFHLSDNGLRLFVVRNAHNYQVLVQDTRSVNPGTALPHLYEGKPSDMPVCEGHEWCLDGCIGFFDVNDYSSLRLIHMPQAGFAEVSPTYWLKSDYIDEDYPSGEFTVDGCVKNVEILRPSSDPIGELERMVGFEDIKQRLSDLKSLAQYNRACVERSPQYPVMRIFLHSVFYGNPGTGKTTVCRLYGSLLKELGLLSKGHVVVADRNVFVGTNFGDTEEVLNQLVDMSKGGVLMFDEAYLLDGVHRDDPNKMVLPMLLSALADERNKDIAVVLCGYKDKLDRMIDQNPGLYSRFVNRFEFKDYTLDELTEIAVNYLDMYGHSFSKDGLARFRNELSDAMRNSNKATWANARTVKSMADNAYIMHAKRFGKDGRFDRLITAEDIPHVPCEKRRSIGFTS